MIKNYEQKAHFFISIFFFLCHLLFLRKVGRGGFRQKKKKQHLQDFHFLIPLSVCFSSPLHVNRNVLWCGVG